MDYDEQVACIRAITDFSDEILKISENQVRITFPGVDRIGTFERNCKPRLEGVYQLSAIGEKVKRENLFTLKSNIRGYLTIHPHFGKPNPAHFGSINLERLKGILDCYLKNPLVILRVLNLVPCESYGSPTRVQGNGKQTNSSTA